MKKFTFGLMLLVMMCVSFGCQRQYTPTADRQQQVEQEAVQKEAVAQVGMPAITNFTEMKNLKMVIELRDQANLSTYCYHISEQTGKMTFIGNSIGYPFSAATQYTSPQKVARIPYAGGFNEHVIPQADPTGIFSPASAEGSWVMLINPKTGKPAPCYFESRVNCFPFRME